MKARVSIIAEPDHHHQLKNTKQICTKITEKKSRMVESLTALEDQPHRILRSRGSIYIKREIFWWRVATTLNLDRTRGHRGIDVQGKGYSFLIA